MASKSPPALIALEFLNGADIAVHQRYSRVTDEEGRCLLKAWLNDD